MSDEILSRIEQRLAQIEARLDQVDEHVIQTRRLASASGLWLGEGRVMVHTLHGLLMVIDANDLIITPQLVAYRQWEPELSELLWNSLHSDSVVVDVGANVGYFTLLAAGRIRSGGKGRVIAIEPNPACAALLERSLAINWSLSDVWLRQVAVGAEKGAATLSLPVGKAANAHFAVAGVDDNAPTLSVPMETLDTVVPEGMAVDFLKIDVEGHELAVLHGATRTIAQSPDIRIVMEWSPKQMVEAGVSLDALRYKLKSLGLVPRRLPHTRRCDDLDAVSPPIALDELGQVPYDNILLTKRA